MSGGWLQTWNNNMPAGREIRFHSTRRIPPHYPHAADSEHGPPLSENDLAKNGQGRPRSVPAKRDCVERGKSRREIFALITTPPLVRVDPWIWQGKETPFFFFLMTTRFGMVLRSANEHFTSLQSKAEVATESCEGKVAACFCQGYRISGMDHIHISHLLTHT
jgi:hypothetical protein